jgi:predicted SAM-dependent methyltransferase
MCGRKHLAGYYNVDKYEDAKRKPEIVKDIMDLDFPENSIEEIRWRHGIEHLWYDDGRKMLERIRKWLVPGGIAYLECPDVDATMKKYAIDPKFPIQRWVYQIYGMQDRATGNVHYSGWTPYIMKDNLTKTGWWPDEISIWTNYKQNMFTTLTKKR